MGHESAYLYSPAFLQALAPIRLLSWPLFLAVWTTLLLLVLRWLSGPLLFGPLIVLTFPELWGGNITILLAAMIVVGFRRPGVWAFAVLTKVTPGAGPAVVRGPPGVAGAGGGRRRDGAPSWPSRCSSRPRCGGSGSSCWPAAPAPARSPARCPSRCCSGCRWRRCVIIWAALGDRRWALPIGVLLAMPVIWWGSFAILTACVALRRDDIERRLFGATRRSSSAPVDARRRGSAASADARQLHGHLPVQ